LRELFGRRLNVFTTLKSAVRRKKEEIVQTITWPEMELGGMGRRSEI